MSGSGSESELECLSMSGAGRPAAIRAPAATPDVKHSHLKGIFVITVLSFSDAVFLNVFDSEGLQLGQTGWTCSGGIGAGQSKEPSCTGSVSVKSRRHG